MYTDHDTRKSRKLLLSKGYAFLLNNFHKFSQDNKIKIALALIVKDVTSAMDDEDDRFINQEITFDDIPGNGDGKSRFERFLHK